MKIICFSDTHMNYPKIKRCDVAIFAGDANIVNYNIMDTFIDYYKHITAETKFFVAGNHDTFLEYLGKAECKDIFAQNDIFYLEEDLIEIDGISFYGSPYSKLFCNWAFMAHEHELKEKYKTMPECDVLITHGPPYDILDDNQSGEHCGSKELAKTTDRGYKYHIFGHIHRNNTEDRIININNITYINCSLLNEEYKYINNPIMFNI